MRRVLACAAVVAGLLLAAQPLSAHGVTIPPTARIRTLTLNIDSPSAAEDNLPVTHSLDFAFTVVAVRCVVDPADAGESVIITTQRRATPGGAVEATIEAAITCANTTTGTTAIDIPAVPKSKYVTLDIGTVTGTVTRLTVYITVRI